MKTWWWTVIAILMAGGVLLVLARGITGEDTWICVKGEWVKHGNPMSAKPIESCPR